jgi:tricorn protease-like protein
MTYARDNDPEVGKSRLLMANPDGSGETILYIGDISKEDVPRNLAWSPDGKQIAYSHFGGPGVMSDIDVFDLGNKKVHRLSTLKTDFIYEIQWMPDGRFHANEQFCCNSAKRRSTDGSLACANLHVTSVPLP